MSMDVWPMISGSLDQLCQKRDFILIRDYQDVLDLPESYLATGETKPHRVIRCRGNLSFRLEYEPIKYASERLILHVVSDSCFIPDLEARASLEQVLVISLQSLLGEATGDKAIPTRINDYTSIAKAHFKAIARFYRLFREEEGTIPTDVQLRRIILSALLGTRLFGQVEPAALWNLYFGRRHQIEELPGEELHSEFMAILATAPWPLSSLRYDEPQVVRRTLWLTAILSQHLENMPTFLAQLHTNLLPQEELSLEEGENLARGLYSSQPELARLQIAETERELTSASIQLLIEKLELSLPERAAKVALEEEFSHLVLMLALYHILLSLSDNPQLMASEALERLQRKLADKAGEGLPYELETCIDLLNVLMDMLKIRERIEPQIGRLDQKGTRGLISPEPFFRTYVEERGYWLGIYGALIRHLLSLRITDFPSFPREFAQSSWDRFRRGIEGQAAKADEVLGKLGEIFTKAVVRYYPGWLEGGEVTSAADVIRRALSSIRETGSDRAYLLILEGMGWDDWELHIRPLFASRYEIGVKPILSLLSSPDEGQEGLKDALRLEGIRFRERQKGLNLWLELEVEGLEIIVFDSQRGQEKSILEDELESGAIVFITSSYILGGSGPKLEEAILPLVTLRPEAGGGEERELFVSQLRLKSEYMEGLEDSLAFSVRYTGENPFELVDAGVEMGELAQSEPFQVLATKQEKEILVPFTPRFADLSKEERGLPIIERGVKLFVTRQEGEGEECITRYGKVRLRLRKGTFARAEDFALDRILGIKPKR